MARHHDVSEQAQYMAFWSWEYIRREAIEYGVYLAHRHIDVPEELPEEAYPFEFNQGVDWDVDHNSDDLYWSSDDILVALISGSFEYRYPPHRRLVDPDFFDLASHADRLHRTKKITDQEFTDIVRVADLVSPDGQELYLIDFSKPLHELVASLKSAYAERDQPSAKEKKARDSVQTKVYKRKTDLTKLTVSNGGRAIGIWIWDQVQEAGITEAAAIRKLKERHNLDSLYYNGSGDEVFRRLHKNAKLCIKQNRVLKML